jgi:hypothetical protein
VKDETTGDAVKRFLCAVHDKHSDAAIAGAAWTLADNMTWDPRDRTELVKILIAGAKAP